MKKIYKCDKPDFVLIIDDERPKAIETAKEYLRQKIEKVDEISRFVWKSDDGSGFTITVTPKSKTVYCSHKFSKRRS